MKKMLPFLVMIGFLVACDKKDDDSSTTNPPAATGCTSLLPNKLSAKIANQEWCSDQSCFGDLAVVMTINGLNGNGSSLTLELDSVMPGTYQITEDVNHMIYLNGDGWESTNDNPGTLVITSNNTSTNQIKGTFTVTLRSPLSGNLSVTEGKFDLFYTE
jgi:hypothetical protein